PPLLEPARESSGSVGKSIGFDGGALLHAVSIAAAATNTPQSPAFILRASMHGLQHGACRSGGREMPAKRGAREGIAGEPPRRRDPRRGGRARGARRAFRSRSRPAKRSARRRVSCRAETTSRRF